MNSSLAPEVKCELRLKDLPLGGGRPPFGGGGGAPAVDGFA